MVSVLLAFLIQAAWPVDRLENGWTRRGLASNGESLLFTKAGPRPNMIWTRQEFRVPEAQTQAVSVVNLIEVDCQGRRSRNVQSTDYLGPNTSGRSNSWGEQPWRYPLPGTLGDAVLKYACE